uniref:Uncharacterized protein n=1 Tax=Megaselia scalaris TaxID=36166 RepID=T1GAK1_MEGSC
MADQKFEDFSCTCRNSHAFSTLHYFAAAHFIPLYSMHIALQCNSEPKCIIFLFHPIPFIPNSQSNLKKGTTTKSKSSLSCFFYLIFREGLSFTGTWFCKDRKCEDLDV